MKRVLLKGLIIFSISIFFALITLKFYPLVKVVKNSNTHDQPNSKAITNNIADQVRIKASDIKIKDVPQEIYFPSLKLNIPIAPGEIIEDKWTLYDDKASWLSTSEDPDGGNVIIYAHNRKGLFGTLKNLKVDDSIVVKAKNIEYKYIVKKVQKISPESIDEVVSSSKRLTLYTCDGAFDQKRLLVVADPIF